jgi:hypothetical protein
MTPLNEEFYYNTRHSVGFLDVRIYRKRANHKWWQREYEYIDYGVYMPEYDADPSVRARKTLNRILNEWGGMSRKDFSKSIADKTMRKVP